MEPYCYSPIVRFIDLYSNRYGFLVCAKYTFKLLGELLAVFLSQMTCSIPRQCTFATVQENLNNKYIFLLQRYVWLGALLDVYSRIHYHTIRKLRRFCHLLIRLLQEHQPQKRP